MIKIKHIMDENFKETTLDDAFIEALSIAEGCSCEAEKRDNDLFNLLKKYPELTKEIKDKYKYDVLKAYDYTIKQ